MMAVTDASMPACKRHTTASFNDRTCCDRPALKQRRRCVGTRSLRRGKCVSDSSAGRSLSPSLLCFRALRPATHTSHNRGVRMDCQTIRGERLRLQFLRAMQGKFARLHSQPVDRTAPDGARLDCVYVSASPQLVARPSLKLCLIDSSAVLCDFTDPALSWFGVRNFPTTLGSQPPEALKGGALTICSYAGS